METTYGQTASSDAADPSGNGGTDRPLDGEKAHKSADHGAGDGRKDEQDTNNEKAEQQGTASREAGAAGVESSKKLPTPTNEQDLKLVGRMIEALPPDAPEALLAAFTQIMKLELAPKRADLMSFAYRIFLPQAIDLLEQGYGYRVFQTITLEIDPAYFAKDSAETPRPQSMDIICENRPLDIARL